MNTIFFALAMIANVLAGQTGTQPDLQKNATQLIVGRINDLNTQLQQKGLGDYVQLTLAWGPVVYQAPGSKVADNVVYVVQNTKAPNDYTIGIAGTNFNSPWDWLLEDGLVGATVPWIDGAPSAGRIALGTSLGLQIVKSLQSVPTVPQGSNRALTLEAYLTQQLGDQKGNIYVTGHSLGGALSPVTGLWLSDRKTNWPNATVSVYTFAGPTPGNAAFAAFYAGKLGANTTRVWNQLDVVPHAWAQQAPPTLSQIPGLYQSLPAKGNVSPSKDVNDLIDVLKYISRKTDYAPANQAAGFSNPNDYADVSACTSDLAKFLVQAVYQHINAYGNYYKVPVKQLLTCQEAGAAAKELSARMRTQVATEASSRGTR
ncbi:MAG TPA: hypothetical protein VF173_15420 [Thermoanaerobaculia bacterium]|nr:hypothetical protein [Thermoanaerobaculia bacterium]